MAQPDFFIIGAPRSGTTSLTYSLSQHPEIAMARPTNSHFFGSDLKLTLPRPTQEEYFSTFPKKKAKRTGDVGVFYLYSRKAAEEIAAFSKDVSLLAILRHPLEMLASLHALLVWLGLEPLAEFERALAAEEERKRGELPTPLPPPGGIQTSSNHPFIFQALYYSEVAAYASQLRRYVECFGSARLKVFTYEELIAAPQKVLQEIFLFLGVQADVEVPFPHLNARPSLRSLPLHRMLRNPPSLPQRLWRTLLPYSLRKKLLEGLHQWNKKETTGSASPPPELPALCREEAQALRSLFPDLAIGWDLTGHFPRGDKR